MHEFSIKKGDTSPSLEAQLLDENNEPRTLTNVASVRFHMEDIDDESVVIDATGSVLNANEGKVVYHWNSGDTDNAGRYDAEFEVEYDNGNVETFPNSGFIDIVITDDIA